MLEQITLITVISLILIKIISVISEHLNEKFIDTYESEHSADDIRKIEYHFFNWFYHNVMSKNLKSRYTGKEEFHIIHLFEDIHACPFDDHSKELKYLKIKYGIKIDCAENNSLLGEYYFTLNESLLNSILAKQKETKSLYRLKPIKDSEVKDMVEKHNKIFSF